MCTHPWVLGRTRMIFEILRSTKEVAILGAIAGARPMDLDKRLIRYIYSRIQNLLQSFFFLRCR